MILGERNKLKYYTNSEGEWGLFHLLYIWVFK